MPQFDMVEQNQVLVQLSHIAHMRHHWNSKFFAEQTHRNKFTNTCNPHCVYLNKAY